MAIGMARAPPRRAAVSLEDFQRCLRHLLEWEREAELSAARARLRMSPGTLEREGHALFRLACHRQHSFFGDETLRFVPSAGSLPHSQLSSGDVVIISKGDPLGRGAGEGVVLTKNEHGISVVARQLPANLKPQAGMLWRAQRAHAGDGWRLDLGCNELAFSRMEAALAALCTSDRRDPRPAWLLPLLLEHSLIAQGILDAVPPAPATHTMGIREERKGQRDELSQDDTWALHNLDAYVEERQWDGSSDELDEDGSERAFAGPTMLDRLRASRDLHVIERRLEARVHQYRRPSLPSGQEPRLDDPRWVAGHHRQAPGSSGALPADSSSGNTGSSIGSTAPAPAPAPSAAPISPSDALASLDADALSTMLSGFAVARLQRQYIEHMDRKKVQRVPETSAQMKPASVSDLQAALDREFQKRKEQRPGMKATSHAQASPTQASLPPMTNDSGNTTTVSQQELEHVLDCLVSLNASQRAAVVVGLATRVSLIQGPPGTGKTRTAVALMRAWKDVQAKRAKDAELREAARTARMSSINAWQGGTQAGGLLDGSAYGRGKISLDPDALDPPTVPAGGQALAVASSNTAVDQLMEGLVGAGLKVVRIGDVVRVRPELRACSLEAATQAHPDYARVAKLRKELERLAIELDKRVATVTKASALKGVKGSVRELYAEDEAEAAAPGVGYKVGAGINQRRSPLPSIHEDDDSEAAQTVRAASAAGRVLSRFGFNQSSGASTTGATNINNGPGGAAGTTRASFSTWSSPNQQGNNSNDKAAREGMLMTQSSAALLQAANKQLSAGGLFSSPHIMRDLTERLVALQKKVELLEGQVRSKVLAEAEVIATTCTGSGHEMLAGKTFSYLVVDEASQIHEAELAIPLSKLAPHGSLTLIGDERQLPPVLSSDMALALRVSLFERLAGQAWPRRAYGQGTGSGAVDKSVGSSIGNSGTTALPQPADEPLPTSAESLPCLPVAKTMLQLQYRMHPAIAAWPNWAFYGSAIANAPVLQQALRDVLQARQTGATGQAAERSTPVPVPTGPADARPSSAGGADGADAPGLEGSTIGMADHGSSPVPVLDDSAMTALASRKHAPPPGFPWPRGMPVAFVPVLPLGYSAIVEGKRDANAVVEQAVAWAAARAADGTAWMGKPGISTHGRPHGPAITAARASGIGIEGMQDLYHSSGGNEKQEGKSKANESEVQVLLRSIRAMLGWRVTSTQGGRPDMDDGTPRGRPVRLRDIGVVSPYLAQVKSLAHALKHEGFGVAGADQQGVGTGTTVKAVASSGTGGGKQAAKDEKNGPEAAALPDDDQAANENLADEIQGDDDDEDVELGLDGQPLSSHAIEVRSVDGYQGREKAVLLFSAVRSNSRGEVGFLADYRRLNVALTRGKRGLIVTGDPFTLAHEPTWASFLRFIAVNKLAVHADAIPNVLQKKSGQVAAPTNAGSVTTADPAQASSQMR